MDEPDDREVDLTPDHQTDPTGLRTALAAVLEARSSTGADAVLADVRRRAARSRRRRDAAGALTAAAALALVLAAPTLVPAAVVGRPAATPVPSVPVPDAGPSAPRGAASPLMNDAQVGALYPGVTTSATTGSIGLGSRGASSTTVGGYCGDSILEATEPEQTWGTTWRQSPGATGVRIREEVLRWEGPDAVEDVVRYAQATRDSPLVCDGSGGGTYEPLITAEPGGAISSQAVLAPGDASTSVGARSTWRVRSISPAGDGRTVVELTVDLPAPDGREAARSVVPLMEAALGEAAPGTGRPPPGGGRRGATAPVPDGEILRMAPSTVRSCARRGLAALRAAGLRDEVERVG